MSPLDVGLLLVRLAGGATFAAHGAQKVFGWWEGPGFAKWTGAIERMGLRPVPFWAVVSAGVELAGGLFLITGFATPAAAALLAAQTTYIVVRAHWSRGFFNGKGGIEFPLQLLAASLLLGAVGPGALSLDRLLGFDLDGTARVGLFVVALAGAVVGIAIARPQPQPASQAAAAETRRPS